MYLQFYPFLCFNNKDIDFIKSKYYYERYIQSGTFLLNEKNFLKTKNYYFKDDGASRNVFVVSPIIFLYINALVINISQNFQINNKYKDIFYTGDLINNDIFYKNSYSKFQCKLKEMSTKYKHFIKTDISNFYESININYLMSDLYKIETFNGMQKDMNLDFLKELLLYCGGGKLPAIENSAAISFIASIIYYEEVENKFISYLVQHNKIEDFRIIRYSDDSYIFINTSDDIMQTNLYNNILDKYNSILYEKNLTINKNKSTFDISNNINEYLKINLYDNEINKETNKLQENNITLEPFLKN